MKRILCMLSAALLLFTGCGKDDSKDENKTVSMYELSRKMIAADKTLPEMSYVSSSDENAGEVFTYLSDADYELVDSYFLFYSTDGLADEIAVVALKDSDDTTKVKKSIEQHVNGRVSMYEQYDPSQTERAENAIIMIKDQYVVLIISENQNNIKTAFTDFLED